MKINAKRLLKLCSGWGLVVLGILGLFLPVLQGILFLISGFLILSTEYRWARAIFVRLRRKYPQAYRKFVRRKKGGGPA